MNPRNIFLIVGMFLLVALFVASSWEAWDEAKRNTRGVQGSSVPRPGESPNFEAPCSPPPMLAERCLVINGHTLFIAVGDVADTDAKRAQGLSGRESMAENYGILFVFEEPAQYSFWMKDMKFPLDFLWIRDGKIIEITQNVPPPALGEQPQTIAPRVPIDMVLEVNAGWAQAHNISQGMDITG